MAPGLLRSAVNSLPNELALVIVDQLADDHRTLCALARTCRNLQYLAEERIYKTIDLLSVKDLYAIIAAFTKRRDRVRAVQTLRILYQYKQNDLKKSADARARFNDFVAHMVNLRAWHIESPYDNFHWGNAGGHGWVTRDMDCFRRVLDEACTQGPSEAARIRAEQQLGRNVERTIGLALLQDLTIHSHGATVDFWTLGGFHCLFRHPALRSLHVSCVTLPPGEIAELASHVGKSPLTTLVFDECELSPKSLRSILRTPARLKNLTLGENVYNVNRSRGIEPVLSKDATASLDALSVVAHSLERLRHLDPSWRLEASPNVLRSVRPVGAGMRDFHSLNYLECDTASFLHQTVIMNRDLAPPSLQTLRVTRHWDVQADFWDQPPNMDHYMALPSLNTLELMQSSFLWHEHSNAGYICDADRLRNRHAKAYRLSKAGINLKMLIEMHRDPALIPPYLQNERVPIAECIYDASEEGFHRHRLVNEPVAHEPVTYSFDAPDSPSQFNDIETVVQAGATRFANSLTDEQVVNGMPPSTTGPVPSAPETPAPETDHLNNIDIQRIASSARRALDLLKRRFVRRAGRPSFWDVWMDGDDDGDDEEIASDSEFEYDVMDELEVDDLDENEDLELEMELDDLDELDGWEEDGGVHVYEHEVELYIEVYENESGSGSDEGQGEEGAGSMDETDADSDGEVIPGTDVVAGIGIEDFE